MGKKAKRAMMAKVVALAASKKASQAGNSGSAQDSSGSVTAKALIKGKPSEVKKKVKELRRTAKMQRRKDQKKRDARNMWEGPPPSNLVGKLELPKPKYHSYFEFMENTERKEKKLEFQVTRTKQPFPGYKFVPVGDPIMTTKCKELSREQDAMIYIVSETTEQMSKISDHVHRIGYHFREYIVDEARMVVGETKVSTASEPIPKSQEDINRQADAALRDLFPRIPNTDRQMILDHAFKLGNVFNGAPVVGLQADIPLSRRVQLAVLAHIRHTHTRYDLLLRETSWENARKVVEPICLDFIIKWRGDEETGRDQISEILREVVVISDSDDSSDDSLDDYDDDSSDEGEASSTGSEPIDLQDPIVSKLVAQPQYSGQTLGADPGQHMKPMATPSPYLAYDNKHKPHGHGNKLQRGFKRYQAAWDEAVSRRNHGSTIFDDPPRNNSPLEVNQTRLNTTHHIMQASSQLRYASPAYINQDHYKIQRLSQDTLQPVRSSYSQRLPSRALLGRDDVVTRPPPPGQLVQYREAPSLRESPVYMSREQKPSQVVRASPSQGLKDMLVPSIETSSDGSSERHEFSHGAVQQDKYSQRRMLSPPPLRQVIVIDDSPEVKRRRVVHNDMPLTMRQSEFSVLSSVNSRDFISQRKQRDPVHGTAPSDDFSFAEYSSGTSRRYERNHTRTREYESPPSSVAVADAHMNRQSGFLEPSRYAGSSAISRPLPCSDGLHHEYPGSRAAPTSSRVRDDLRSFPDNLYGDPVPLAYETALPRPEYQSDRSFITLRRAQDPSLSPIERPLYHAEQSHEAIFYDQDGQVVRHRVIEPPLPLPLRQRPVPAMQPLPRTRQPVRDVIVLD